MLKLAWHVAIFWAGTICSAWRSEPVQIFMGGTPSHKVDVAFLGDSFTAGIGAGDRMPDDGDCLRYDKSYPMQLQSQWPYMNTSTFTFEACSGAEATAITDQTKKLEQKMNAIVLSFGGNDVGFSDVVINCFVNLSPGSNHCDDLLAKVDSILNKGEKLEDGRSLEERITATIDEVEKHLKQDGAIIWVGYGAFFDKTTLESDDDPCKGVSWNIFESFSSHTLTKEHRKTANSLVDQMNSKLKGIVEGRKHYFVDWDKSVDEAGLERVCAPGSNPQHKDTDDKPWVQNPFGVFLEPPFSESATDHVNNLKRGLLDKWTAPWLSTLHPSVRGAGLIATEVQAALEKMINDIMGKKLELIRNAWKTSSSTDDEPQPSTPAPSSSSSSPTPTGSAPTTPTPNRTGSHCINHKTLSSTNKEPLPPTSTPSAESTPTRAPSPHASTTGPHCSPKKKKRAASFTARAVPDAVGRGVK